MRELVECLREWLATNREDAGAYLLLSALTNETLKRAGSSDPAQREFDAQQLAEAAGRPATESFDNCKRWVDRAKLPIFCSARESAIEDHFRSSGHDRALRLGRRSPGGKHRAVWFLEAYALPDLPAEAVNQAGGEEEAEVGLTNCVRYEFAPPGTVTAAWYAKPLLGAGSFVTRSWRGLLWVAVLLVPIGYLFVSALAAMNFMYLGRPLQTSDLASLILLGVLGWMVWRLFLRPMGWLLSDRIILATEVWTAWNEETAQLELVRDKTNRRQRLQLVRYTSVCPVCAGTVELRHSQGPNRRRLIGCCSEAPHDHTFSFDRIRRIGHRIGDRRESRDEPAR